MQYHIINYSLHGAHYSLEFIHLIIESVYFLVGISPFPPLPTPLVTTNLLSVSMSSTLGDSTYKGALTIFLCLIYFT